MSGSRRTARFVTAGAVVLAWATVYVGVLLVSPPAYDPTDESAAKVNRELAMMFAVPTAAYVVAALLVLHHWRAGARSRTTDPPGRVLAAALVMLPEHRRDWGAAMTAELAGVRGRAARWWFALSCARAVLRPPLGGRPLLVVVSGVLAVVAVGVLRPELSMFAGSAGALLVSGVVAVARSRRVRFPVPAATVLVVGAVAAATAMTVILLLREPADHRSPARLMFLAAVLVGCLTVATTGPGRGENSRIAAYFGGGAALLGVAGSLLAGRVATDPRLDPTVQEAVTALVAVLIFLGPAVLFFLPALWAAMVGRSFRAGVRAGVWTAAAYLPLAFALSVHESLRVYANGGGVGFDHLAGPVGVILDDAVFWHLVYDPLVAVPCAVFGAAIGATHATDRPAFRAG